MGVVGVGSCSQVHMLLGKAWLGLPQVGEDTDLPLEAEGPQRIKAKQSFHVSFKVIQHIGK